MSGGRGFLVRQLRALGRTRVGRAVVAIAVLHLLVCLVIVASVSGL